MKWVWDAARKTPTIAGTIMIAFMTAGATQLATQFVTRYFDQISRQEQQGRAAVLDFAAEARAFDLMVIPFVQRIMKDDHVDDETLGRLIANIVAQRSKLDAARPYLPANAREDAAAYATALEQFARAARRVGGVQTMREFWERANDVVAIRSELLTRLYTSGLS